MPPVRVLLLIAAIVACPTGLLFAPAVAKDKDKERKAEEKAAKQRAQEAAYSALQRGEILPLTRILDIAAQHAPGNVIEIEFKAGPVYEVEVLMPSGQIRKVRLDARTGELLAIKGG